MAKTLPKINVTKLSDLQDKQNSLNEDTRLRSLKEQVDSGGKLRASKRRKSKKSVEQIQAEIDAKDKAIADRKAAKRAERAKISPAKFYALDAGLKLEEENKVQTEKITIIKNIQKIHRTNHQKEKSEIAEINNGVHPPSLEIEEIIK